MQWKAFYPVMESIRITVIGKPSSGFDLTKRTTDIIAAALLLLVFVPVMAIIVLFIKLDSPGPILVSEKRVGRRLKKGHGNPLTRMAIFDMYRFRTTYIPDAHSLRLLDEENITHIGRFLQYTSLDELPQLFNVLKGDMSLIGPRPIVVSNLDHEFDETLEARFDVRPGITGLWQVSRNHIGTLEEMAKVDIFYIQNRSIWLDLQILFMSLGALIKRSSLQHWVESSLVTARENVIYNLLKRLMDLVLALVALIILSPLMLTIAALIRLDSPGPVFFRQVRAGKRALLLSKNDGGIALLTTKFTIYKFRTMYNRPQDNDAIHQKWVQDWVNGKLDTSSPANVIKPDDDPRVTKVGRFLRATSLDELPQLINVVKGDMSLVGPRPVPVYEVEKYEDWHYVRLDATPGITGLWQINLRGRGTLDQMVELDLEYLKKRSLWSDIKILFLTIPAVVAGRGAK